MPVKKAQAAPDLEVWQNAGMSTVMLRKFNSLGHIIDEAVPGGRKVYVTPEERRMNQEVACNDQFDHFANGMLVPVRLIDSEEDTKTLQANPNALSETAMKALFKSQLPTFKAKVEEINNPTTLGRMLEVAEEVDASIRQVEAIQSKLQSVSPQIHEVSSTQIVGAGSGLGTRAPKSPSPRSVTGRAVEPK